MKKCLSLNKVLAVSIIKKITKKQKIYSFTFSFGEIFINMAMGRCKAIASSVTGNEKQS